jgi:hypothetical protein
MSFLWGEHRKDALCVCLRVDEKQRRCTFDDESHGVSSPFTFLEPLHSQFRSHG